jgi:hypothetical protein
MSFGLIVARMDPPPELEEEFNDWYDSEHIAERLRVPGFLSARRLVRDAAPRYAAIYDLESLAVLESQAYKNVSGERRSPWTARMLKKTRLFDRRIYEQLVPGSERVRAEHPFTLLRVVPHGDRAQLERHVREVRERSDASARLFAGKDELLVVYTAASESFTVPLADGESLARFGPYGGAPREDERFTQMPSSPRAAMDAFNQRGWSDGLPIIPPTDELVREMLGASAGGAILGRMPPRLGQVTLEAIAINAVMAGCHASHFPIVVAAVEALLDPAFNLLGVQATTHPCTALALISGPAARELGFCLGGNAMGEGTHANATVGRAIRLVMRNLGGARPGKTDFATQGSPARYSFVLAEDEAQSPFAPFHTTRGFEGGQSVVTMFAAEGPHNINDHSSACAESLLLMIAGTMATLATNDLGRGGKPLLVLGPEHVEMLRRERVTREQVQSFLFEHARVPVEKLPREMREWLLERHDIDRTVWSPLGVPVADRPDDIFVTVAGGRGRHSAYVPSFAFGKPVSRAIAYAATGAAPPLAPDCNC